jgi:hypothetical protein
MQTVTFVGEGITGRRYYAVRYSPGCLDSLPWRDESFDCAVCSCDADLTRQHSDEIAAILVAANTEWITTTGRDAEWLHDLIDRASVHHGRQHAVGDGSPMTAWDEDAITFDQMAEAAYHGTHGSTDQTLALVVGPADDVGRLVESLRVCLTNRTG